MADLAPLQYVYKFKSTNILDGMGDRIQVGLFEDNGGLHRVWTG